MAARSATGPDWRRRSRATCFRTTPTTASASRLADYAIAAAAVLAETPLARIGEGAVAFPDPAALRGGRGMNDHAILSHPYDTAHLPATGADVRSTASAEQRAALAAAYDLVAVDGLSASADADAGRTAAW